MSIKPLVIGVTMGDPAGIGPEITTALLAERVHEKEVRAVLIGCAKTVEETARRKGLNVSIRRHEVLKRNELRSGGIDVYDPDVFDGTLVQPGDISNEAGEASMLYNRQGAELAMAEEIDGLVTSPVTASAKMAA